MANNIKRNVSEDFKRELEKLIFLAGYDKNNTKDLKAFCELGGGAEKGISEVKINWVLKDGLLPREDFIYCLAEIAVSVMETNYYFKQGISNPIRYELNRLLMMCEYIPQIGNIFPVSEKYRRPKDYYVKRCVAGIPNIFWKLTIPFEEAQALFDASIPEDGLEIRINDSIHLYLKKYSYQYINGVLKQVELQDESQNCEAIGFKLVNTDRKMRFATIEAIRQINSSLIPMTLINGNWIDILGTLWEDIDYDLTVKNYYNYLNLYNVDYFFYTHSKDSKRKGDFDISELNKFLISSPEYQEIYKRLTFKR